MALYASMPSSVSSSANRTMKATATPTTAASFDNRRRQGQHGFHFLLSHSSNNVLSLKHRHSVPINPPLLQKFRVCSQKLQVLSCDPEVTVQVLEASSCNICKAEAVLVRKCSPFLESSFVSDNGLLQSTEWSVVPDIWRSSAEKFGDRVALVDRYHDPPTNMTFKQLEQEILDFAEGLRVIGVNPCEKVALFADNSCRWLVADQGIMATGAINVVRGSRSSVEELLQIYNHSESVALAVDNPELFNRIAEALSRASLKFVILLWGETSCLDKVKGVPVYSYNEIIKLGRRNRAILLNSHDAREKYVYEAISTDDVATLVYTSGTTGNPKGVMLTHRNFLHQINNYWNLFPVGPGDRVLSMLPPWHVYERSCEYFLLAFGVEQVYTTVKNLKEDLRRYQPTYMISVPIVFETLYSGIQKQISSNSAIRRQAALSCIKISMAYMEFKRIYEGKYLVKPLKQHPFLVALVDWLCARTIAAILFPLHLLAKKVVYSKIKSSIGLSKAGISGGGSLPLHVDRFFEAIDIKIQVGYGLTETSPVVAARSLDCNVLGSVGKALRHTETKVVDSESGKILPPGSKGIVKVRGPQIMKGYYKNHLATKHVLDEDGWLNTGDIGWIAPHHTVGRSRNCGGIVVLEGRGKDTIVLLTGENVEPSVLEEAALRSSMIQQILIVGQDRRRLGAIVVPNKDEVLMEAKKSSKIDSKSSELSKEKMTSFLYEELRKWTADCTFQFGGPILVIEEPFTIDNGLMTPTMKIRRDKVVNLYKEQIDNLYK